MPAELLLSSAQEREDIHTKKTLTPLYYLGDVAPVWHAVAELSCRASDIEHNSLPLANLKIGLRVERIFVSVAERFFL